MSSFLFDKQLFKDDDEITEFSKILQYIISKTFSTKVSTVEIRDSGENYDFIPYFNNSMFPSENINNNSSMFSSENIKSIWFPPNLKRFIGYKILTESQLSKYALTKMKIPFEHGFFLFPKIKDDFLSLVKIDSIYKDLDERMSTYISKLIREGYFNYPIGYYDLEYIENYLKNLCEMFEIEIIDETDKSNYILKFDAKHQIGSFEKSDIKYVTSQETGSFYTNAQNWLRDNLISVKEGKIPKFTFTVDFFYGDYSRLYGEQYTDVILKYATYLSFADLCGRYPILRNQIQHIQVNPDLSITCRIPKLSLVKELKASIEKYLENGISLNKSRRDSSVIGSANYLNKISKENHSEGILNFKDNRIYGAWNIVPLRNDLVKNIVPLEDKKDILTDGIVKRWIVQKIDPNAYPMIIKDSSGNEILIHSSSIIKYPSPFDFSNVKNIEKNKEELKQQLLNYHRTCHDNIDPISLENISSMNLEELLSLIHVKENKITYCYTSENIEKLEINPITRSPFNMDVKKQVELLDFAYRGLFDIGPLYGLISFNNSQNESIKVLKVPDSILKYTRVKNISELQVELQGSIYSIDVIFKDGTISHLFDISLKNVDFISLENLKVYMNKLWEKGILLDDWSISLIFFGNNLSSFPINITHEKLINAADTIYDGEVALNYLKSLYLQYKD